MSVTISSVQEGVAYFKKLMRHYKEGLLITGAPNTGKTLVTKMCCANGLFIADLDAYSAWKDLPERGHQVKEIIWDSVPSTYPIYCGFSPNILDFNWFVNRPHLAVVLLEIEPRRFLEDMKDRVQYGNYSMSCRKIFAEYSIFSLSNVKAMFKKYRLMIQHDLLLETQSLIIVKMKIPKAVADGILKKGEHHET